MHPGIENAGAIDAEKHAQPVRRSRIVGMREGIHTTLGIVIHVAQNTVHNARRARRTCYLSRIEHVQADGIVGLVARTIADGRPRLQAQLLRRLFGNHTLNAERWNNLCQQAVFKAEIIQEELGRPLGLKVPHHPFRKATDRSLRFTRELHGDIVAGQHHLVNLSE